MNDMENKDRNDVPENQGDSFHPSAAESTEPSASSADSTAAGEQKYQYQPPVGGYYNPGQHNQNSYGGYSFGQQPPADQWNFPEYGESQKPNAPKGKKKA